MNDMQDLWGSGLGSHIGHSPDDVSSPAQHLSALDDGRVLSHTDQVSQVMPRSSCTFCTWTNHHRLQWVALNYTVCVIPGPHVQEPRLNFAPCLAQVGRSWHHGASDAPRLRLLRSVAVHRRVHTRPCVGSHR